MKRPKSGGGWAAIRYTFRKGQEVGFRRLWRAMRAKNACKTCALGMGGQQGGMADEKGHFPEVCKKSLQAMAADMRGRLHPRFFEEFSIGQMQAMSPRELEAAGRLVEPVIRRPGEDRFRTIGWKDALALVAERLRATDPRRAFFYASGRSSNEAGFLLQLLARAYGTNHVNNCSYYCHQASGVGLRDTVGTPVATVSLDDVEACDLFFLIGGNPASNHPRLMNQLMKLRRRGGEIIVVNPVRETGLVNFRVPSNLRSFLFGSEIASLYLQPAIGGDIAFLAGMAKRLLERGAVDSDFIENHTEGFGAFRERVDRLDWEEIEQSSGLSRPEIERAADLYARSEQTLFAWTMGITHHLHGTENVHWIANLALMRGMAGKPGAGLLPIRGHSNVQGMGSVGVTPAIRQKALAKLTEMGLRLPDFEGYDTMASMEAAARGEMDVLISLGGNLFGSNPSADWTREAFSKLDLAVYLSTTLNTGHAHGLGKTTLILPVRARDEEDQSTTQESMFSYVRLSEGGPPRYEGPRTETDILSEIGDRAMESDGLLNWKGLADHEAIRKLIADQVAGYEAVKEIGATKKEFAIPGRRIAEARFPTPSGKANFQASPLPELPPLNERELRLMTVRSEGQFNTVVYEDEDLYRGQERRDVIVMSSYDRERLGLDENQPVTVVGPAGSMNVLARSFDIARGCALMYYPEANALLPKEVDPRSKTPAFKSTVVRVEPLKTGESLVRPESVVLGSSQRRERMKAC